MDRFNKWYPIGFLPGEKLVDKAGVSSLDTVLDDIFHKFKETVLGGGFLRDVKLNQSS